MVPPLLCAARWEVLEGLVDSVCEAYRSIWDGGTGYADARAFLLLGTMDSLGSETQLPTSERMVSVTVGAMITADDEVQLVSTVQSWFSPGYSVDKLGGEECICYICIVA